MNPVDSRTTSPNRNGYQGYVTVRAFNGFSIPVPVQNLMMRDYTTRKGMLYILPLCEHVFPNCYMQLESTLNEIETLEGILMCSIFMLPASLLERLAIYKKLHDHGAKAHFVMENVVIEKPGDEDQLEELYGLNQMVRIAPRKIDFASLGIDLTGTYF